MGYFTPKILILVALALFAATVIPVGVITRLRYARAKAMRGKNSAGLGGAAVAGILLRREQLDHALRVELTAEEFARGYAPRKGCVVITDPFARAATPAALAEAAYAVALATLHADGDPDFARAEARRLPDAILANLLPPAFFLGLILPGARSLLLIVAPLMFALLAARALMNLPVERRAAERALALLDRHALIAPAERAPVAALLRAHANLPLARPLLASFWVNWLL